MLVRYKGGDESWMEECSCPDGVSPEVYARDVIKNFNSTLHPHEMRRELVRVRGGGIDFFEHDWEKRNLFTVCGKEGMYDVYGCTVCGITGKRFGLGGRIVRDKKYKSDKYKFCKPIERR